VNKQSLVGVTLLALGVFILFGGLGSAATWVLGYWDKEYVETYRGYDIYYFVNIHVYGWMDADGDWHYHGSVESAEKAIDDYLEEPVYVEAYNGWDIYQTPGSGFYYAVNPSTGEQTTHFTGLEELKEYLDLLAAGESLEAEVEGRVYTSPGEAEEFPTEVDIAEPGERLSWLRWLGLPLMALGAVLALGREEK